MSLTEAAIHETIAAIPAAIWDAAANPPGAPFNPFVTHAFLECLERSGSVGEGTSWQPAHLALRIGGAIKGLVPLYLKYDSRGEFVFDHHWAEAYQRAGGRYYPKLQVSVPFTPVTGPRLLTGGDEALEPVLGRALIDVAKKLGVSSLHVTFPDERVWRQLLAQGYLARTDQQFHWEDKSYGDFPGYLAALSSIKRKNLRRERAEALKDGLTIAWITGQDIKEHHWDAFWDFYQDTGNRKWGEPPLTRSFFSRLGETMARHVLLVFAMRGGRPIAGALNLIGSDTLYGRYWGAIEHHPFLHFEVCYYQAIEYALAHGLARVEAGAQGAHKLARGYMPAATFSAHWIADPGLRKAIERYLTEERRAVAEEIEHLSEHGPYRKTTEGN